MNTDFVTDAERAAASRLRPLRDVVILKRVPYEHPLLVVTGITLNRGVVVSVGPGRRIRRLVRYKNAPDGPGAMTGGFYLPDGPETGKLRPMRVAVGDVVEWSPNKHTLDFDIDGCTFVAVAEQSIYGKDVSGQRGSAILDQRVAGWERGTNGGKPTFLAR